MQELPLADVRSRLSELVAEVEKTHARVTITEHGHPAAVLVSPEELAALEETVEILSDPGALADIREAEAECVRGELTTGDEMRRLMEERRSRVARVASSTGPSETAPASTSCGSSVEPTRIAASDL